MAGLLLPGCASTERVASTGGIARSYLPQERSVPPLDSLVHLDLAPREGRLRVRSSRSLPELRQAWSAARERPYFDEAVLSGTRGNLWDPASYGNNVASRPARRAPEEAESFATLWSRELALAHAAAKGAPPARQQKASSRNAPSQKKEGGWERLLEEKRREEIARLAEKHRRALRFDVYLFEEDGVGRMRLDDPSTTVVLRDDTGAEYRPDSIRVGPILRAKTRGASYTEYRHNVVYFDRDEAEQRQGKAPEKLELWVRGRSSRTSLFAWRFEALPRLTAR